MKTNEEILNLVYKKNDEIEFIRDTDGLVTILEPQDHVIQRGFRKIGFKIPECKNTKLDDYASFVYLNIDGENTVEKIGELLLEKYGEDANPLYERLLLFLNHIDVNCKFIKKIDDELD